MQASASQRKANVVESAETDVHLPTSAPSQASGQQLRPLPGANPLSVVAAAHQTHRKSMNLPHTFLAASLSSSWHKRLSLSMGI